MLVIETLKYKISDFLNSNTCSNKSARDFTVCGLLIHINIILAQRELKNIFLQSKVPAEMM